jgi:hypothetical protein
VVDTKVRDNFDIGTDFMMWVGDAWVDRERRETMQVLNPSTGRPITERTSCQPTRQRSDLTAQPRPSVRPLDGIRRCAPTGPARNIGLSFECARPRACVAAAEKARSSEIAPACEAGVQDREPAADLELRDGSGIGIGAPQFGPRRTCVAGLTKYF